MSEDQFDKIGAYDYSCEAYYEDVGGEEWDRFYFDDEKQFLDFLKDCGDQDRIKVYSDSFSMHRPLGTPYHRIVFQRIDFLGPKNEPWKADYQVLMNIDLKNQKVVDFTSNPNDLSLLKEHGFEHLEEKVKGFLKALEQKNEVKMDDPKVSDHVIISLVKDCVDFCDPMLDPYGIDDNCAMVLSANSSLGTNLKLDAEEDFDEQDVKTLIEAEYGPCVFKEVCCAHDFIDLDSSTDVNGLMFMPKEFIDETGITDLEDHFEQSCKLLNAYLKEENAITVATFETERKTLEKFLSKHGDKEIGDFVEKLYGIAMDLDYPWHESVEYALNNDEKVITDGLIENNLQCYGDFDENAVHLVCEKGYQDCKLYGLTEADQRKFEQMKEQEQKQENKQINTYQPTSKASLLGLLSNPEIKLEEIDTSKITDMSYLFANSKRTDFSGIEKWNTSNVTDMDFLFGNCENFNQDISNWDVGKVTNMFCMFKDCECFNQDISKWNVSNVTDMSSMFSGCKNFNQPLNDWNVGNVEDMSCMFSGCEKFNQPLDNWNTQNVKVMIYMFKGCEKFNQPLNNWNVSNVTDMECVFGGCEKFNQPLNDWDVSNVTVMDNMFAYCCEFNQPLNDWCVREDCDTYDMFKESIQSYDNVKQAFTKQQLNDSCSQKIIDALNNEKEQIEVQEQKVTKGRGR